MSGTSHDLVFTVAVIVAFAALVTAHVVSVFGVFARRGAVPGFGAMLLPPLAPYFAARSGMTVRACVWVVAAIAYGVALVGARA